jgi:IS605 OrfB family transposase
MKKSKRKILSSRLTLKFANAGKKESVRLFLEEYGRVVKEFAARFWGITSSGGEVKRMPSGGSAKIDTWLSARAVQAASKQASGIVNGALAKNRRREWRAQQFDKAGHYAKARKLRAIIARNKVGCPMPSSIEAQLDARFFEAESSESTSFDQWLVLKSMGSPDGTHGAKIKIPLNFHVHYNKMARGANLLKSIRLSENEVSFSFEAPKTPPKADGTTLGIDIGQTSIFSLSSGSQIKEGQHGWTLKKINDRMARRKKGSKGFSRSERHRKNFVGESVNKINFDGVSKLRIEKIRNLKKGRRTSRSLSHWSATDLSNALKHKTSMLGVRVEEVNPMFTSQRCASCGWVQKSNRKGERFVCKSCGNAANADLNGSLNIGLDLPSLPKAAREKRWNRRGFFWNLDGFTPPADEFIVRQARKPAKSCVAAKRAQIYQ